MIEALVFLKPLIDGIVAATTKGMTISAKAKARKAVEEGLIELLRLNPDMTGVEAKIALARQAGLITPDFYRLQERYEQVRSYRGGAKKTAKKSAPGRSLTTAKKSARKAPAKKSSAKKSAAKKSAKKAA